MTVQLNPSSTAVLFMDFQNGILARVPDQAEAVLQRARLVLGSARDAGAFIAHVTVAFRAGYPEASQRNLSFSSIKATGRMLLGAPETQISEALAPRESEPLVVKHRVGAFSGTELELLLRSREVETLVLLGVATSGVVLSTVRHAADADYRIVVVSDGCADADPEVHRVLMGKVFPRQATIATCDEIVHALQGGS